jgi:hypothetical protein
MLRLFFNFFSILMQRISIPPHFANLITILGANVSVHFEEEWQPIIQKRSGQ